MRWSKGKDGVEKQVVLRENTDENYDVKYQVKLSASVEGDMIL